MAIPHVVFVFNLINIKFQGAQARHYHEVMSETESKTLRLPTFMGRLSRLGISQKIGMVFMALLMVAVVNVILVERMMGQSDRVADTVNVAGKLRMLGQRIALQTVGHSHGLGAGEPEIRQLMRDFESTLAALADGGYVFGLHIDSLAPFHAYRVNAVREQWAAYRHTIQQLLEAVKGHQAQGSQAAEQAGPRAHELFSANPAFNTLLDDMTGHSARLLERTEALMNGIVDDVQAVQSGTMHRMYALVAVDILLILLAFMAVRRQIVVPLRDLSTHCMELAEGNYKTRFEVSTHDEIGHLAKVFNESAARIGSLVERIERDRHSLVRAESMFRGIAENSMVGVYIAHKGRFRYVNARMEEIFGYARGEMLEDVPSTLIFPECDEKVEEPGARRRLAGDIPGLWVERKGRRKDGSLIEVEVFGSLMTLDDELVTIGIAVDITRRKEHEAQAKLAMLVHRHSSDAMVVTDVSGSLLSVNPAFTRITGYQPEEVLGRRLNILSSGRHDEAFYQAMWADIHATGSWEGDIWNRRKNGEIYAERLMINTCSDDNGEPRYRIGLFSDITAQKEADALMWRQANYDLLTGLPNRQRFLHQLQKEIERAEAAGQSLALVYLDIDDFKDLNDTLGHGFGDQLLVEAAQRLQSCVRPTDLVARLGGDEFVFILTELSDPAVADHICELARERLAEPFLLDSEQAVITASMGLTFYPVDGRSSKDLMQNADLAMYAAKARGRHQIARFQPSMQMRMYMRRELARDLAVALEDGQFHLAYQPIIDLGSGRIEKVECLLRWEHPEKGMVSPGLFVPFAEDSGLINRIGEWVFQAATERIARWRKLYPQLQVSINVSPAQFMGKDMRSDAWLDYLSSMGMKGEEIVVEITERLLMEMDTEVSSKLIAFRDAGVQIALDDFGTGYSSMSYLKRFDIDYIKIDQCFVRNLGRESDDLVLCEAMIGMAHRLGLKVVAEGVETATQRDLLVAAGCDFAQGYLFSPAVQADRFEELLREGTIATAISSRHHSNTGRLAQRT